MYQIEVDTSRCRKDGACVAVCPSATLVLDKKGYPAEVLENRCILCGHCVAVCGCDAIKHIGLPREPFFPVPRKLPGPAVMDGFLMSRRSVREFKERPVDQETMEAMLDVARRAPTATNSQTLHWIVVSGAAKVRALAEETVKGIRALGTNPASLERWDRGYDFVLRAAPTLVVACTPADYEWGKQDCAIALTFLELAAESRGLGACWAGYLTRIAALHAPLCQALSVPEGYAVHGGLMLGEHKYTYRRIPPRKPLSVRWL
jgi:nitroreductase/NAD-dependent dihydropyrimidine dehydrogenase PreA subunit